ncbi:hypothetical protein MHU86_21895 [Fragilaria crotonensis]|nr:hypothetical protein MHU86_21895 [Fragilaria crotonensis]
MRHPTLYSVLGTPEADLGDFGIELKTTESQLINLDNASLTTTDYAVEVRNPPKDARDPDEWKQFFDQFGQVASITVALDNEELVRALLLRRTLMSKLEDLLPPGLKLNPDNLDVAVREALPSPCCKDA